MRRVSVILMFALAVAVPSRIVAEEAPKPVLVASFFKVVPGKGETMMGLVKKYDKPVLDKLMADAPAWRKWGKMEKERDRLA